MLEEEKITLCNINPYHVDFFERLSPGCQMFISEMSNSFQREGFLLRTKYVILETFPPKCT